MYLRSLYHFTHISISRCLVLYYYYYYYYYYYSRYLIHKKLR
jgi:hypothetical protein